MKVREIFESNEQWRKVPGWSRYEVSTTGKVRDTVDGELVAQWDHKGKGTVYKRVTLRMEGYRKNGRVHRLVAMAFIPNPKRYPEVDHIDGNSFNNHVSNLEWVTGSQNIYRRSQGQGGRREEEVQRAVRSILDVPNEITR